VIAKEFRALAPVWVAVACAMVASTLLRDLRPFGLPAYFIGAAALGAMSIGHEYSHRTLPLLLTLPVPRRRLLLSKLTVLAVSLLLLAALATRVIPIGIAFRGTVVWLPFFAALFIAPYLTVISRSPVGGAVFTMGIAGMLMVAGEWIGIAKYGYARNVDTFRIAFIWQTLLVLCAASAILMWRTFTRLQSFDGPGAAVDLAPDDTARTTALTRGNPTWLLVKKELRLQQWAFVLAAIYVVVYTVTILRTRGLFYQNEAAFIESMLYADLVAIMIGSVASAEERHLRTLDAQLLLPMRTSRQWTIKVAVVLGLTLVLGIVLPALLAALYPPDRIVWARTLQSFVAVSTVLGLMALASVSLYVSTLCSGSLWPLVLSVPATFATAMFVLKLGGLVQGFLHTLDGRPDWSIVGWASAIMTMAMIGVVLRLALTNHRSADRSRTRIAAHAATIAAATIVAATLVGVVGALSR
jgi:hypothetical protein